VPYDAAGRPYPADGPAAGVLGLDLVVAEEAARENLVKSTG
jgi:hypothetical protein